MVVHKPARNPAYVAVLAVSVVVTSGRGQSKRSPLSTAAAPTPSTVAPGWLGISGEDVDANFRLVAKQLGRIVPLHGVAVDRFINHPPAESDGLRDASAHHNAVQDSDIVETLDGHAVTAKELDAPLLGHHAGDIVTLRVWSAHGPEHDLQVKVAAAPTAPPGGSGYFPGD